MRLLLRNLSNGRSALRISSAADSDGADSAVPLILNARVDDATYDRMWVAATVCFGTSMIGRWTSGPAISENVYLAISDYLKATGLFYVDNVLRETPEYRTGVSAKLVRSESLFSDASRAESYLADNCMVLETLPLGNWTGSVFNLHHYIVATNGFLHDRQSDEGTIGLGSLATAVLLSNDLCIDEIRVKESDYPEGVFKDLCNLLSAVGLRLKRAG